MLLAYSKHDDQAAIAQRLDLDVDHTGIVLESIENDSSENLLTEDEATIISDISLPFESQQRHHRLLIAPDAQLKEIDGTELDVYLSTEQYECIESYRKAPGPTLVQGGAGTGKSMIALHVLADRAEQYQDDDSRQIAYFTQSAELRRNSEARFRNIAGHEASAVHFQDIDGFCMDALGYSA